MKFLLLLFIPVFSIAQGSLDRFAVPQEDKTVTDSNIIYKYDEVDIYPYYKEGMLEFYKLFNKKLWVPSGIRDKANQILITISCVIERDGRISNADCKVQSFGPKVTGLKDEIIKAMQKMPNWVPGKVNGFPVRTKVRFPYSLRIQRYEETEKKDFRAGGQ